MMDLNLRTGEEVFSSIWIEKKAFIVITIFIHKGVE